MKKFYALTIATLCFFVLSAQSSNRHFLTLGISNDQLHFKTTYQEKIFSNNSSYTSRTHLKERHKAAGIQLGYTYHLNPRWEFSLRSSYSGAKYIAQKGIFDTIDIQNTFIELPKEYPRTYRALWTETLAFWSATTPSSPLKIQLGMGVSYLLYQHHYRAGFSYNLDFEQYDFEIYNNEKGSSWGIPLQLQFQYVIHPRYTLGINFRGNLFFDGHGQSGTTLFGAYRL